MSVRALGRGFAGTYLNGKTESARKDKGYNRHKINILDMEKTIEEETENCAVETNAGTQRREIRFNSPQRPLQKPSQGDDDTSDSKEEE